jgi:LPXTG-site transpeptidase (sortase) family protein
MSAPSSQRLGRFTFFTLAAIAVLAGISATSVALYGYVDSAGDASVPSLSSRHRTDPGGIYDRRFGPARAPAPVRAPQVVAAPAAPIEPPLRDAAYRIVIDRIGVNASVFTYGLDANRVPEVPLNGTDVAWYNFSAPPGTGSNAVFAGHVTWGGNAVFYELDEVQVGDRINLRGDSGVELSYVVSDSFLVDPDDPNALSVMSPTDKDVITLITCGGSFYYTGDPVFNGDYTHRRIVRATFAGMSPPAAGG